MGFDKEDYLHKKPSGGQSYSKRGSSIAFREQTHADKDIQNSIRLGGSSSRHNSMPIPRINMQEKPNYPRTAQSVRGKAIAGCSRPFLTSVSSRASSHERQNQAFLNQSVIAESNCQEEGIIDRQLTILEGLDCDDRQKGKQATEEDPTSTDDTESVLVEISAGIIKSAVGNIPSSSKQHKKTNRRLTSSSYDAPMSSFTNFSSTMVGNYTHAVKPLSQTLGSGVQKYGLQNLSCTSVTDALPPSCSSNDSPRDRRANTLMKRAIDGENSGSRSKVSNASSSRLPLHIGAPALSLTIPETVTQQQGSRRSRFNRPAVRDDPVSVRTRRASSGENRLRLSREGDDRIIQLHESIMIPQLRQIQMTHLEESPTGSSRSFTLELPHNSHSSSEQSQNSHLYFRNRSVRDHEDNNASSFHVTFGDRDIYRRFSMGGVAEMLLALVRIEQDEELTYEQLSMLETSLFRSGLGSHDRHRDMRMDIDNMSYEELLALEEKMGTVSTSLSEEQLSRCLERSRYASSSRISRTKAHSDDDIKCSICQEDYIGGDEVGKLSCKHQYHVGCIQQWLRQKNWCPICKSSALPL